MQSRTRIFTLSFVGAVSTALLAWGCSKDPARQICVDNGGWRINDGERVDDSRCGQGDRRYHWYYFGSGGGHIPAVGGYTSGGSFQRTGGQTYYAVPSAGVTRGGFGSTGGEGGGGGGE